MREPPRRTPAPALAPSRAAFPPPDAAAVLKQTPFLPSSQSAVFLTFLSCHRRRCHWCRGTGEGSAMPAGRVQGRADLRCGCSCLGQPKAPSTRAPSCRGCFRHLQIDWLTRPKGKSCLHSSGLSLWAPRAPRAGQGTRAGAAFHLLHIEAGCQALAAGCPLGRSVPLSVPGPAADRRFQRGAQLWTRSQPAQRRGAGAVGPGGAPAGPPGGPRTPALSSKEAAQCWGRGGSALGTGPCPNRVTTLK